MTILVLGASGATGRLLVQQLLERGLPVRALIRPQSRLPDELLGHPLLTITRAELLALDATDLARQTAGCSAIACCLGHVLSWKGIYGQPRRLVSDAIRRVCEAAGAGGAPVRVVLMNSAGCRNRGLAEPVSLAQRMVVGLIRLLLPPHADNEAAAEYLQRQIGLAHPAIAWSVVRPDTLDHAAAVSPYSVHAAAVRSAIFDAGRTSRINVAHFMAELITDPALWARWQGQMPVIYNRE